MLHDRVFLNTLWIRVHERSELLGDYEQALDLAQRMKRRIAKDLD